MTINYNKNQEAIRPDLAAANINSDSFLATDYLNHFNEIVMLLEMVPDMPEMAEDCMDWTPLSYSDHFMQSGFTAKELAVKAYELAPLEFKGPFDQIIAELDLLIGSTVNGLRAVNVSERGVSDAARMLIANRTTMMQDYLAKMNKLIHGKLLEEDIEVFNEVLAPMEAKDAEDVQSQADIDALFD
ncbi:hypothetical protein QGN29_12810 [Temperatibacter marinus]|uniref:Uncharacterized protein n=1 Tax=Temperatibacter marinus TaxID=1456591 RepID=A0AA52EI18_9PROT|nr:hypothetical protein [Temperatibacter marinus]WND02426.1 hypothetical protein QGN29_12810 [Temperatibacter marinus]